MKRVAVITVGKTHSGKTIFACVLEQHLVNSVVIDQDLHAEFINTFYSQLLPARGPNTIKYAITQTIVDYAIERTDCHLIVCNSNRSRAGRLKLLRQFREKGFLCLIVHFDIPDYVLYERVSASSRSTKIFRSASTFEELLIRQQADRDATDPAEDEADYLFVIKKTDEITSVVQGIVVIANN